MHGSNQPRVFLLLLTLILSKKELKDFSGYATWGVGVGQVTGVGGVSGRRGDGGRGGRGNRGRRDGRGDEWEE